MSGDHIETLVMNMEGLQSKTLYNSNLTGLCIAKNAPPINLNQLARPR